MRRRRPRRPSPEAPTGAGREVLVGRGNVGVRRTDAGRQMRGGGEGG